MKTIAETNQILVKNGFNLSQLTQSFPTYQLYDPFQMKVFEYFLKLPPMKSILLCGTCGVGKDFLDRAYIREMVLKHNLTNFFCGTPQRLFRSYRDAAFGENRLGETEAFKNICDYELLMLVDVGTRDYTPPERTLLIELIDFFYETGKPVLISTNCQPDDLKTVLDPRICDRLAQMVVPFENKNYVPCVWQSFRRRNSEPISLELEQVLRILPPTSGRKSFLCCEICGLPETSCNCWRKIPETDVLAFRNKNYKLIYTDLDPEEYHQWAIEVNRADKIYKKLSESLLSKFCEKNSKN